MDKIQAIKGKRDRLVIEVMDGSDKGMMIRGSKDELWQLHEIYPEDTTIKLYFETD